MLYAIGGRVITVNGYIPFQDFDKDIILKITVKGSCFPSKITQGYSGTAALSLYGQGSISNKVFIDFADGTGEHSYDFKVNGTARQLQFRSLGGGTTPATVQGTAWDDAPVYYYQDLPTGVINTVQEEYDQQRTISIRFEKPQSLVNLYFSTFRIYGVFPSAVAKLKSLLSLRIMSVQNLTSFPQDFSNPTMREFYVSLSGTVMDDGIPGWVYNSPYMETLSLYQAANLSGSAAGKKVDQLHLLKNTLKYLDIGFNQIDYQLPANMSELNNLVTLRLLSTPSTSFRLPADLSGFTSLTTLMLFATAMPLSEYQRAMTDLPAVSDIDMCHCNKTTDFDLPAVNTKIKRVAIGGNNTWNARAVPSFVNKLTALTELDMSYTAGNTAVDGLRTYGDFSACVNLQTLNIGELTAITTSIPTWFSGFTQLKSILTYGSFQTQARTDTWVSNVYAFVVANASMTTGNTKFRQMTVGLYNSVFTGFRPTGTYQQPTGYVQGSNNGSPASPLEQIWVLTFQYAHMWIIKP